jgi:hypothetical protein
MREQLNDNPMVQLAVVAVLLIGAGFFVLSSMGGGGEEEAESGTTEATVSVAGTDAGGTATGATPGEAVEGAIAAAEGAAGAPASVPPLPPSAAAAAAPLPRPVTDAFEANRTVVLLFVRSGGIDDRLVRDSVDRLRSTLPEVSAFVVPAERIARYAAIAQGVAVDRVPALVVVRPKRLDRGGIPVASVSYGFQSPQSVVQAAIDAGYKGPTIDYHP